MGSRALTLGALTLAALASVSASAGAGAPSAPRCDTTASTLAVVDCARLPVVASLGGRYTPSSRRLSFTAASSNCRAAEVVFYAARDWLRLAPKLAERASPCADYYISIPPLVSDKTKPRPNQAARIRALGPKFHAMAEIHWTTWQRWVRATGASWYDAGVEARRRMAAAGYDVARGDTWAVNEFPSTVRRGLGSAREDARDFVYGLYEGDGRPAQGAVFVIGVMHGTSDASLYKATLKEWFADTPFWLDMTQAVRFWGQEVYGDARRWGVPGTPHTVRRDYLNDFLQHAAKLAAAAPAEYGAAAAFLGRAHTPIANAGWQWESGLGWTMLSAEQMQHFVSAQTYALRNFAAARPAPDRFGFAWAPNNASGMPHGQFVAATGGLLDRLGAAIADSATTTGFDPGVSACLSSGVDWCAASVAGGTFTDAWRIFSAWRYLPRAFPSYFERLVTRVRRVASRARPARPRL